MYYNETGEVPREAFIYPINIIQQTTLLCAAVFILNSLACGEERAPNVIIIYGDDVGYGDVGVYGSEMIPTPNIDKLAAEGLVFTDGHCSSATCTPSRYALLTGVYGFRNDISILAPNAPLCIPTEAFTLPDVFKKAGYATSVIGKWHLGIGEKGVETNWNGVVKPGPLEIGFDTSYLLPSTNDRVPCVYLDGHLVVNLDPADPLYVGRSKQAVDREGSTAYPDARKDKSAMTYYPSTHGHNNSVINGIGRIGYMAGGKAALWNDETMADVFVEQAKSYIIEHKNEPFFLYFASQDIHVPRAPNERFKGSSGLSYRGDAMVQFDWATGELMKSLEENGIAENTIVIFSSDNGPVYDDGYDDGTVVKKSEGEVDRGHDGSGVYRGGKYQIYEGGTRVPFIVRWPAKIKPGTSKALVNQVDFLSSFSSLLEVEIPEGEAIDSRDMMKAFMGEDSEGLPYMIEEALKLRALRMGDYKYIQAVERRGKVGKGKAGKAVKAQQAALYDLSKDPGELENVISQFPEKAAEMKALLEKLIKDAR